MAENEKTEEKKPGMKRIGLLAGVIGLAAAMGMASATFLGGAADKAAAGAADEQDKAEDFPGTEAVDEDYAYLDFEPVQANLDTQRLARHISVKIALAYRPAHKEVLSAAVEKKKPELKNKLIIYFSGCRLDEVGGAENRNRIRREIRDALNDLLWPGKKPLIDHVLFQDFKVQ